jgi:hypothetical protein
MIDREVVRPLLTSLPKIPRHHDELIANAMVNQPLVGEWSVFRVVGQPRRMGDISATNSERGVRPFLQALTLL